MKDSMQDTWQKFQQELADSDTHCDECANGTDSPCINCQWDESVK